MDKNTISAIEFVSRFADAKDKIQFRKEISEQVKNGELRVEPGMTCIGGSVYHLDISTDTEGNKVIKTSMPWAMFLLTEELELVLTRSGVFSRLPGVYNEKSWHSVVWPDMISSSLGWMGRETEVCPDEKWRLFVVMSFMCMMAEDRRSSTCLRNLMLTRDYRYTKFLVDAWDVIMSKHEKITAEDVEAVYDMVKTGVPAVDEDKAYTGSVMNIKSNEWLADVTIDSDKVTMISHACPTGCHVKLPEDISDYAKARLVCNILRFLACMNGIYPRNVKCYAHKSSHKKSGKYKPVSMDEVYDGLIPFFKLDKHFFLWDEEFDYFYNID